MNRQVLAPAAARVTQRRALRDEVFDALMEMIAGGAVAPDAPLAIDPLAAQLGVSPTPVREALVQLESTGLVVRTALRGYRVAPPMSREMLHELFDARRIVEVAAARQAMDAPNLLAVLRRRHQIHAERAEQLAQSTGEALPGALNDYLRADWGFHQAILEAAGNRFLLQVVQDMATHGQRLRHFLDTRHTDAEQAVAEHAAVLAAFESGDVDAVVDTLGGHIDAARARALADLQD